MEKFVIGIVAILCVHIGFVLYVGLDETGNSARLGARNEVFDQTRVFNFPNRLIATPTQKEDAIMIARGGMMETEFAGSTPAENLDRSADPEFQPVDRPISLSEVVERKINNDIAPRPLRTVKTSRSFRATQETVYQNASYTVTRSSVAPGKSLVPPPTFSEDRSGLMARSKKGKRGDKGSLLSKMSPIVKKPYDWLKAVGSWVR